MCLTKYHGKLSPVPLNKQTISCYKQKKEGGADRFFFFPPKAVHRCGGRHSPGRVCQPHGFTPLFIDMEKDAREALQVTKEIVVKFIETGRVSPANMAEVFPMVYEVVHGTIAPSSERRKAPGKDGAV